MTKNYLHRLLETISPDDALIVRYICDDFGAIDIDKSFRLLMRAFLMSPENKANTLSIIKQLEMEKQAEKANL